MASCGTNPLASTAPTGILRAHRRGPNMSHSANLIADLTAAIGPAHVLQGADMARYCRDWTTHYTAAPLVVVRPASTADVAQVMQIAARHGIAVIPVSYTHLDVCKRQIQRSRPHPLAAGQGPERKEERRSHAVKCGLRNRTRIEPKLRREGQGRLNRA